MQNHVQPYGAELTLETKSMSIDLASALVQLAHAVRAR